MSHYVCTSPQISSKCCVYVEYVIDCYQISRKLWCFGKKLAAIYEIGTIDCINLTVIFRYWSCSDARRNRKRPVAVLKELNNNSLLKYFTKTPMQHNTPLFFKSKTRKRLNRTPFNQTRQGKMQIFEGILFFEQYENKQIT